MWPEFDTIQFLWNEAGWLALPIFIAIIFRKEIIAALKSQDKSMLQASLEILIQHNEAQSKNFAANNEMFRGLVTSFDHVLAELKDINANLTQLRVEEAGRQASGRSRV